MSEELKKLKIELSLEADGRRSNVSSIKKQGRNSQLLMDISNRCAAYDYSGRTFFWCAYFISIQVTSLSLTSSTYCLVEKVKRLQYILNVSD